MNRKLVPSLTLRRLLPVLPVLAIGLGAGREVSRGSGEEKEKPVREIEVVAQRFEFKPAEIKMKAGTRLKVKLSSRDTVHGFNIIGTLVNVLIPARGQGEAKAVFEPPQPGRYPFKCSKVCGAGHTQMRGVIIVE